MTVTGPRPRNRPRRRPALRFATLLVGVITVVAACSIQPDSAPRDVPQDQALLDVPTPAENPATGDSPIYVRAPDSASQPLRSVLREAASPLELIDALVDGPNDDEQSRGLSTALPQTIDVNSVRLVAGVVNVDVSADILELNGSNLTTAVAQIVLTASQIAGARSVVIRVDGERREWPDGDGVALSRPLTPYDFIDYAESSQPAFPATPSPTTTAPPPPTSPSTQPAGAQQGRFW